MEVRAGVWEEEEAVCVQECADYGAEKVLEGGEVGSRPGAGRLGSVGMRVPADGLALGPSL